MCCSVLQSYPHPLSFICTAFCCTPPAVCVAVYVAVCCSVMQSHLHPLICHLHYSHCLLDTPVTTHTATHCNTHCNTLQHTLQHTATHGNTHCLLDAPLMQFVLQCAAVCCSMLQCVAVCCSVLQSYIHPLPRHLTHAHRLLDHAVCVALC